MPAATRSQKIALASLAVPNKRKRAGSSDPSVDPSHSSDLDLQPVAARLRRPITRAASVAASQASEPDALPPAKRARKTPSRAASLAPSQASNAPAAKAPASKARTAKAPATKTAKGKKQAKMAKKGGKAGSRAASVVAESVVESQASEPAEQIVALSVENENDMASAEVSDGMTSVENGNGMTSVAIREGTTSVEIEHETTSAEIVNGIMPVESGSGTTPDAERGSKQVSKQVPKSKKPTMRDHFHKLEIARIQAAEKAAQAAKEARSARKAREAAAKAAEEDAKEDRLLGMTGGIGAPYVDAPNPFTHPSMISPAPTRSTQPTLLTRLFNTISSPFRAPTPQKLQIEQKPQTEQQRQIGQQSQSEQQSHSEHQSEMQQRLPQFEQPPATTSAQLQSPKLSESQRSTHKRKRSATEVPNLATITESPEANLSTILETPSRIPAQPQSTGLVPRATQTPGRISYRVRRAAKDAREAGLSTPRGMPAYARRAPITPIDTNADRRKLHIIELEKARVEKKKADERLAALQQAVETEAPRKTKRVKVDHLKTIPHNKPGDPEGSFRVPDIDSDDEIEVDEDAEMLDNPFHYGETFQPTPKQTNKDGSFSVPDYDSDYESDTEPDEVVETSKPANIVKSSKSAEVAKQSKPVESVETSKPGEVVEASKPNGVVEVSKPHQIFGGFKPAVPAQQLQKLFAHSEPPKSPVRNLFTPAQTVTQVQPQAQDEPIVIPDDAPGLSSGCSTASENDFELNWPVLPQRGGHYEEASKEYKQRAGEEFKRGFDHWMATGELTLP